MNDQKKDMAEQIADYVSQEREELRSAELIAFIRENFPRPPKPGEYALKVTELFCGNYTMFDTMSREQTAAFIAAHIPEPIIYKVRMFVNDRPTRGKNKGNIERIEYRETVIIGNLDYARAIYHDYKNAVATYNFNSRYQGKAELFIPHVFDNGMLADWPDNDQYIERYEIPEN
jgi:hypothetical protein